MRYTVHKGCSSVFPGGVAMVVSVEVLQAFLVALAALAEVIQLAITLVRALAGG